MTQTPGPAVDLIEHAAGIIAAKVREPNTAPYHWAGALWEAGMLQPPGHALAALPADLRELIDDLTDEDPCEFDHHGYCQAHGWMATEPRCPHARAKELLAPEDSRD